MTRAGKHVLTNSRRLTNIKTADVTGNASPQVIPKFNTQMIRVVSFDKETSLSCNNIFFNLFGMCIQFYYK